MFAPFTRKMLTCSKGGRGPLTLPAAGVLLYQYYLDGLFDTHRKIQFTAVVERFLAHHSWLAGIQIYLILPHGSFTSNTVVICSE